MKKSSYFSPLLLIIFAFFIGFTANTQNNDKTIHAEDAINICCSQDLYELTKTWAHDYSQNNQAIKINVKKLSVPEFQKEMIENMDMGIISSNYYQQLSNTDCWCLPLAREVIVPVYNAENPSHKTIQQNGLAINELNEMLMGENSNTWKVDESKSIPLTYYYIKDENNQQQIAKFLGTDAIKVKGQQVKSKEALINKIKSDPGAIAFCKLIDLTNPQNNELTENIRLLPIDRNGNNKIDYFENFYQNPNQFSRAVWVGKFPGELINNVYAVCNNAPENESQIAFLKWILTDGQNKLSNQGYSELIVSERQTKIEKLTPAQIVETAENNSTAGYRIFLIVAAIFILGSIVFSVSYKNFWKKSSSKVAPSAHFGSLNEETFEAPNGLYFDKTHTWAFLESDGKVKIGIDDFLQHIAGPFTRIEMKKSGEKVKKNEEIVSLSQNGKQINLYAPVSGVIKEVNSRLSKDPTIINKSPYNDGWIFKIEPSNWLREIQFLQMADNYKEWLKKEFIRLKDFVATSVNTGANKTGLVFQDGGEIKDHLLQDFGPEVWEDFQKNFIETSELK